MGEEHNLDDIFDAAMEDMVWGDLPEMQEREDDMYFDPNSLNLDDFLEDESMDFLAIGEAYADTATD